MSQELSFNLVLNYTLGELIHLNFLVSLIRHYEIEQ